MTTTEPLHRQLGLTDDELSEIIGLLEVLGAIGIMLAPWWLPLSVAAATGLILLMIGAAIAHLRAKDPIQLAAPALGSALLTAAAVGLQIAAAV